MTKVGEHGFVVRRGGQVEALTRPAVHGRPSGETIHVGAVSKIASRKWTNDWDGATYKSQEAAAKQMFESWAYLTNLAAEKPDTKTDTEIVYVYVLRHWACYASEIASSTGIGLPRTKAALAEMDGSIIASEHVNGEKPLTYQTYFDVENDNEAITKGYAAYREWAKSLTEKPAKRSAKTGPRYTDAQIKKGQAARKAGKTNKEVAEAAGVKSPNYFTKILKGMEV